MTAETPVRMARCSSCKRTVPSEPHDRLFMFEDTGTEAQDLLGNCPL